MCYFKLNLKIYFKCLVIIIFTINTITGKFHNGVIYRNVHKRLLKNFLNTDVNPCEDIIQYSCGRWNISENTKDFPYSKALNKTNVHNVDSVKDMIISLLQDPVVSENYSSSHPLSKVQEYYNSCLDLETQRARSPFLVTNYTHSLLNTSNLNQYVAVTDWVKVVATFRPYLDGIIFSSEINRKLHESSKFTIYFNIPKKHLRTAKYMLEFVLWMIQIENESIRSFTNDILQFEKNLGDLIISEGKSSSEVEEIKIEELIREFPHLKLKEFITLIHGKDLNQSEVVYVHKKYLNSLDSLISKTPKEIIIYFTLFHFATYAMQYIVSPYSDKDGDRMWREKCVQMTVSNMNIAVANLFAKKYLKSKKQQDLHIISENIKNKSIEILKQTDWIDDSTRENTIEKIRQITFDIGFPKFIMKRSELKNWYGDVEFDKNRFFETTMSLRKSKEIRKIKSIGTIDTLKLIDADLTQKNAMYETLLNKIIILSGLAQLPLFDPSLPQYMKYGIMGLIVGHEIFHSLDYTRIHFEIKENWKNLVTNKSLQEFHRRADCLIHHYDSLGINGNKTLDESIADNIGIKVAYLSYVDWLEAHKNDSKLLNRETINDLNLTSKQLFFVSYVQDSCEHYFNNEINEMDPHSSWKIRALGTFSNTNYFAEAFNCPKGSKLNPNNKCVLW